MVHGLACSQEAKHHGNETTRHETGNANIILGSARITQLGKEDPLGTFHQLSLNDLCATQSSSPEGQVENMMQTKGAKHTQHKTIYQSPDIARGLHQSPHAKDELLEMGPDKEHKHAKENSRKRGHNGDKARTAKEPQELGQFNLVESGMQ